MARPEASERDIRIGGNRPPEHRLGGRPVEVVPVEPVGLLDQGLGQIRRDGERALDRGAGMSEQLRWQAIDRNKAASVGHGQADPGERVVRVDGKRFAVQGKRLAQAVSSQQQRMPCCRQVQLIGIRVARAADLGRGGTTRRVGAQPGLEDLGDTRRDGVLHIEDAGELLVEGAAPCGGAVRSVQQPRRRTQLLAPPLKGAVDDPFDFQLARGAQRVLVDARVASYRPGRPHDQAGHERKPGDQAVGHADFEQLVATFAVQRLEGQYRQRDATRRLDDGAAAMQPPPGSGQASQPGAGQRQLHPMPPAVACHSLGAGVGLQRDRHPALCGGLQVVRHCLDPADEYEAAPRHGLDELAALAVVPEHAAQARHHLAQVVLLDHQARP